MRSQILLTVLRDSVKGLIQKEPRVAVAYSGGVDSSVVAALASETADARCYTAVVPGSFDERAAPDSARQEGRALEVISLSDSHLRLLASKAVMLVGRDSAVAVAYTIPLLSVIDSAGEKLILAGNGADELFGGYAKYVTSTDPAGQMQRDLEKSIDEAQALHRYATSQGKMTGFPFHAPAVVNLAHSIPLDHKLSGNIRKAMLRDAARDLGLPSHAKPKKAAQYSSGVLKRLNLLAKQDDKTLTDWVKSL